MKDSRTIDRGIRGRVSRVVAVGAATIALGAGLGLGLAPGQVAAATYEEVEIVDCVPVGGTWTSAGLEIFCETQDDDGANPFG